MSPDAVCIELGVTRSLGCCGDGGSRTEESGWWSRIPAVKCHPPSRQTWPISSECCSKSEVVRGKWGKNAIDWCFWDHRDSH